MPKEHQDNRRMLLFHGFKCYIFNAYIYPLPATFHVIPEQNRVPEFNDAVLDDRQFIIIASFGKNL